MVVWVVTSSVGACLLDASSEIIREKEGKGRSVSSADPLAKAAPKSEAVGMGTAGPTSPIKSLVDGEVGCPEIRWPSSCVPSSPVHVDSSN